jgi:hypothetical protein
MRKYWLTAAIPLAAITVAAAFGPVAASGAATTLSAKTAVTNRDDSAANGGGNWAMDAYTRGAQIFFKGATSSSNCGGVSPCYSYTGKISDVGHFTTVVGQPSPGFGYLNGGSDPTMQAAVTGTMNGSYNYVFYTTVPISGASAHNVPASISGDTPGTGNWVEQFFPGGTQFWDSSGNTGGSEYLGTTGGWTYNAKAGADHNCPNVTSQWVDASATGWGSAPADGNILAPDASGC